VSGKELGEMAENNEAENTTGKEATDSILTDVSSLFRLYLLNNSNSKY
jgi:hypothetical protein